MQSQTFSGKRVLITGGGTGMGRAAALRLGLSGAQVVIAGRRRRVLDEVVAQIRAQGGSALAIATDVADSEQVRALFAQIRTELGGLDLAWNNAGVLGEFLPIQQMSLEGFDELIATNLRGVYACLQAEISMMLEQGVPGAIVNTSSWTAHGAMPGISAYAATKGALDALMRTLAIEVGEHGIRVNNVSPGIIATPMGREALGSDEAMRPFASHAALRRVGESEDVADAVLWLLSGEARFVTGQSLLVDGGFTLGGLRPWMR
ncbi:SDR family oxidoreductase [Marinobacterium sp. D7]|uniref:SDR family NAD(P)-dependent oxidoreductase n=1 Tax=Marinobacterium ramblicola TaxID=2849041 RepID=UPI001C2D9873|nr:SDR family oxidoreductase [Marinobacterium ramblicola]MBV1786990.1 SDR family oxidoreductase [Marinobacterium ramblicola]